MKLDVKKCVLAIGPSTILAMTWVAAAVAMTWGNMASGGGILLTLIPFPGLVWLLVVLLTAAIKRSWGSW